MLQGGEHTHTHTHTHRIITFWAPTEYHTWNNLSEGVTSNQQNWPHFVASSIHTCSGSLFLSTYWTSTDSLRWTYSSIVPQLRPPKNFDWMLWLTFITCRPTSIRWCAISIETPIIHLWPTDSVIYVFNVGKPTFPVSAANLWNSLPAHLTSAPLLTVFRQRLKTFLCRRLIIWHSELTFCCVPNIDFVIQATQNSRQLWCEISRKQSDLYVSNREPIGKCLRRVDWWRNGDVTQIYDVELVMSQCSKSSRAETRTRINYSCRSV